MSRESLRRRLASLLVRRARRALPPSRQSWADAMQSELQHVAGDWQALRWALGCLVAGYVERFRALDVMDVLFVRWMVALLLLFKVFGDFFATGLTVAYRTNALGVAERLGQLTAGDDYRRLIPLMDAVPAWLHGLWVLAGVLYLVALARLLWRAQGAHLLVLAALGLEILAEVIGRPIVAATGVVVNPNPSLLASVVIPFIVPLSVALVLWWSGRQRSASIAQPR